MPFFIVKVYLESYSYDPDCTTYCGPNLPYMVYDGNEFCVQDASSLGGWKYVDFSFGGYNKIDPPLIVKTNC